MLNIASAGLGPRLTVDLAGLARNWRALEKVSAGALCGAVVKADAYGVGIVAAAEAFYAAGARFFFTATVDEGLAVRGALPDAHIFILDGLYPGAADVYAGAQLMPCLSSASMLEEWLAYCVRRGEAFPAALHFDTGMNRLGFRLNEAGIVKARIAEVGFAPQMVMSHLACADQPNHEMNRVQLALFQSMLQHFPNIPASLANSAGLMTMRDAHFQMVRPGIALYGGRAVNGRRNPMSRVVTLEAPILQVRDARTGESVGYGATYTLARDSRIATLGLGYADGFFRTLSSANGHPGGRVAIRGRVLPVIGRVSMDLVTVDITDLGNQIPVPGEMAEILGPNISVDEQADSCGTIGYEILTALRVGRYQRRYVDGPEGSPQLMPAIPTLETVRLSLRPYRLEDFDAYAAMWADPAVVRFIGGVPFSREQAWTRFLRQIGLWHHLGFGFFALEHRQTGAFVGEAGFHDLRRNVTPSLEHTMEAGWGLVAAMQGKGLAEEAMRAAIGWAAEHGTGERLTCMIDPGNGGSLHVAAKLGFSEFARTEYGGKPVVLLERRRAG